MIARLSLLACALLLVAPAAVAPAQSPPGAPALVTDRACYFAGTGVVGTATGLTPGAPFTAGLGTRSLPGGIVDAGGNASVSFDAPGLRAGQRRYTLTVGDGAHTVSAPFDVTLFDATITPSAGRPQRRVRLRLFGWFGATVYMHLVAPGARSAQRTVRVARTRGPCGRGARTLAHLHARRPRRGRWAIVFDTRARYRRAGGGARIVRPELIFTR